jgi:hypothetical protein
VRFEQFVDVVLVVLDFAHFADVRLKCVRGLRLFPVHVVVRLLYAFIDLLALALHKLLHAFVPSLNCVVHGSHVLGVFLKLISELNVQRVWVFGDLADVCTQLVMVRCHFVLRLLNSLLNKLNRFFYVCEPLQLAQRCLHFGLDLLQVFRVVARVFAHGV